MSSDYGGAIREAYPITQVENYCIMASTALMWFDWALLFSVEVPRIWRRKLTGATLVYLLNRYTALFKRVVFILETLSWNRSDESCGWLTHADDVLLALNYFAFAAFTILRVYAVWGRDWKPLVVVIPLSLTRPLLFIAGSMFCTPVQAGPPFGCMHTYTLPDKLMSKCPAKRSRNVELKLTRLVETISTATTVTSEGIFLALTWIRTYGIKRDCSRLGVHAPLTTLLLRDGTAYFVLISTLFPSKVVSIISDLSSSPSTFLRIWPYFDEALTSSFLCRFMLDLRGINFSDGMENELERSMRMSNIRFTSGNVFGNVGAALRTPFGDHNLLAAYDDFLESDADTLGWEDGGDEAEELTEFTTDPFEEGIEAPLDAARHRLP